MKKDIAKIVDASLDKIQHPIKKKKLHKPRVLPKFDIQKPSLDQRFQDLDIANVVHVPEELLKTIASNIDSNTAQFSNILLSSIIPSLLSYQTGTSYARAAFKDGLNIEIDFDKGIEECVKSIGYLNVLFFFIKKSKLPVSLKKQFMQHFSTKLAEHSLETLISTNRAQDKEKLMQELQAVISSKTSGKTVAHTLNKEEQPKVSGISRKSRK